MSNTKKKLLVISQYFYPEQFRINDLCVEWVKRGYEVTVVTGIPNYPQGKFYPGYSWFRKTREEHHGIHVIRLPLIPRSHGSLMLALNYLSFVISGGIWSLFTRVKADKVFIFEVSPMTQALPGVWYAKRKKIPCLIYVQDLWPENVEVVTGIRSKKILGAISKMADYIYRNCQHIFATSPSFVKRIEERKSAWSDGKSKVVYWPQYAEEFYHPVKPKPMAEILNDDSFKIIFTGNIGYAQGLDILPQTAELLRKRKVNCSFYIVGDGRFRPELEKKIDECGVRGMFHLLGRKNPEEIPQYLANCDAAFLSFADNELFQMTIPAKLQSYMACGMPIIAAAGGETARVINEAECGMCSMLGDTEALADIIEKLKCATVHQQCEMGRNAINYYEENYERSGLVNKIEYYLK